MRVEIYERELDLPSHAKKLNIETRTREDTGKLQINATNILDLLEESFVPKDAYCMIGLLNKDLFPRKGWNFVFGISRLVR